jgi:RNA-binding protein Tab2/Atab2
MVLNSSPSPPPSSSATAAASTTAQSGETGEDDDGEELEFIDGRKPSSDWELDCYSRPVVAVGGKKLWEVLLTDSSGSFRYRKALPSNQVNSKELRKTVEDLMEDARIDTKPSTIRFFRGAMFNSAYFFVFGLA